VLSSILNSKNPKHLKVLYIKVIALDHGAALYLSSSDHTTVLGIQAHQKSPFKHLMLYIIERKAYSNT
jgi:hypothetical protein